MCRNYNTSTPVWLAEPTGPLRVATRRVFLVTDWRAGDLVEYRVAVFLRESNILLAGDTSRIRFHADIWNSRVSTWLERDAEVSIEL